VVLAYHAIFTAYGFWLPNDPRGSWSDFVRSWELLRFGQATKVDIRRSVAARPHDPEKRLAAKSALRYPAVEFTGRQAMLIAAGFRQAIDESGYVLHACSILPEHVHMVVARHTRTIEKIVGHLKGRSSQQLAAGGLHPLVAFQEAAGSHPSPWARRGWKVFLNDPEAVRRAIAYVEANPLREGKPPQRWSFVVPYEPAA
jgi:REP element-mobilizing transposase RayT